ncbi:ribonuclease P protein component [Ulvibacter antarcticus]|uniref:Ribonuclease P protein component n=2 Tax=Ulvibacter antarcticus TaxID=442714 RepID=A0A3L9YZ94_9FLAO|nr:ribonuclease P protein component [Ulvibacter antarcticus]
MNFRLPPSEKLKSSKTIAQIFDEGKSFSKFPIKFIFIPLENTQKTRAAFAVPKRNFKFAVTRNRIKRQLREVYRLQKPHYLLNSGKNFALLILFVGKDKPQYAQLEKSMIALLKKLEDENS